MAADRNRNVVSTGFALGGLGASNLHGLGFLHAAMRKDIIPNMISCTSGQVHAVWKYLQAKNASLAKHHSGIKDLEDLARDYANQIEIKPKLPFPEIANDLSGLTFASIKHLMDIESFKANPFGYFVNITLNNMPARTLAATIQGEVLQEMSDEFNRETTIAIAFNSYNPREGVEHVYLNPCAAELLDRSLPSTSSFRKTANHRTEYRAITPNGILDALWIYEYGFQGREHVDGAYFRQVMLSELSRAKTIFVARPIQWKWTAPLPITFGEREELKTDVFFNAAYYGERFRIELLNRLLENGALDEAFISREGYHKIDFYEIEPKTPKPFVGYFSEAITMFLEAREETERVFDKALSLGWKP